MSQQQTFDPTGGHLLAYRTNCLCIYAQRDQPVRYPNSFLQDRTITAQKIEAPLDVIIVKTKASQLTREVCFSAPTSNSHLSYYPVACFVEVRSKQTRVVSYCTQLRAKCMANVVFPCCLPHCVSGRNCAILFSTRVLTTSSSVDGMTLLTWIPRWFEQRRWSASPFHILHMRVPLLERYCDTESRGKRPFCHHQL